jgi:hypothetical protein
MWLRGGFLDEPADSGRRSFRETAAIWIREVYDELEDADVALQAAARGH